MNLDIECPKCGAKIDLTERISGLVAEQSQKQVAGLLEQERKKAADLARREAEKEKEELGNRLKETLLLLDRQKQEMEQKLQMVTAERVRSEAEKVRAEAEKSFTEKLQQKDLLIAEFQKQVLQSQSKAQELEAKLSQGSAQAKGILAEEDLFQYLKSHMPSDRCEIIKQGQGKKGTDVIIRALRAGQPVGSIIVDDKWAAHWSAEWPEKVWGDMQMHRAEFAYIAVNASAFPEELRQAGFGLAPCRKAGVRVWVVDRSNLPLVQAVLLDTVDKILKIAEIKAIYGAGSKAETQFQAYLAHGYETDLREKAKHLSAALKSLNDIYKKVTTEYEKAFDSLQSYWLTESKVHQSLAACFGPETVKPIPQIQFQKPEE